MYACVFLNVFSMAYFTVCPVSSQKTDLSISSPVTSAPSSQRQRTVKSRKKKSKQHLFAQKRLKPLLYGGD